MEQELIEVVYDRKPADWHELETCSRPDSGEVYPTPVVETREMTELGYEAFIARPRASREWLAGKGGWKNNDVFFAIAQICPALYVDPSGSDYGRYVGRTTSDIH